MNKYVIKEAEINGKKVVFETGELAPRANMAVKATCGGTVVLVTAVAQEASADIDFFPLTINYEEKLYASGLIKTSRFVKRDGRATDDAIITRRLIDHAVRPLFPTDYLEEVQVTVTVLSLDEESDPEILSMLAVSACLHASNIPFNGPMGTLRVGMADGKFVLNPKRHFEDANGKTEMDLMVSFAGKEKRFLAIEAEVGILPEERVMEAIYYAYDNVDQVYKLVEDFANEVNPEGKKKAYVSKKVASEVVKAVEEIIGDRALDLVKSLPGQEEEKEAFTANLKTEVLTQLEGKYKKVEMIKAFDEVQKKSLQRLIMEKGIRPDGRGIKEIRELKAKVGLLPRTHGSGLFSRGVTQALTVATLGSPSLELFIQNMYGERTKRYIHYYNFPPFATGEAKNMGSPKPREIGHGMLAEKALRPVIPDQKDFPYMILLVSETLGSSGSSSMAATCGSSLALMDAGVPIKDIVGGVAIGLMTNEDQTEFKVLTDLAYKEDAFGFMDFKMTGTRDGVTAIQVDMKLPGIPMSLLKEIFDQSREGRHKVIDVIAGAISKPKENVSEFAPKLLQTNIPADKIGMVIGAGGRNIKDIQESTGTEVYIQDDGMVVVSGEDIEMVKKALFIIESTVKEVKVGEIYDGVVKDLLGFGALVEILPGKVGLLHVSEIAHTYVESVEEFFKIGDSVRVKVIGLEDHGKISLSKKALEERPEGMEPEADRPRFERGDRGGRFGGRGPRSDRHGDRESRFRR
jgi:polyribonucleotide nucleotidyltransferase